jgi:hypothetical protein
MIIPPRPSHAAGIDMVRTDIVIVRKRPFAEGARTAPGDDFPVHQLAHFGIGADVAISARVLGIVNATDAHLMRSSSLRNGLPAAASQKSVNWAQLISTESDGFLQFDLGGINADLR